MKRVAAVLIIILAWCTQARAVEPGALTTLRAIHSLNNGEASHQIPVQFEATVTYFRGYEHILFVQDDGIGIYVEQVTPVNLLPGDRVLIIGTTRGSFLPFIESQKVTVLHHGELPTAVPSTFDELIQGKRDSIVVSVRGLVRTADLTLSASSPLRGTTMQLLTDGGYIDVSIDSEDANALRELLDAEVEVTGVAGGTFDGKMQLTGVAVHVSSLSNIKILKSPSASPWSLPLTPMNKILSGYHVNALTGRVRIQGSVTYYQPGSAVVLQNGARSLWIMTQTHLPIQVGDRVDATGIPDVRDSSLTLTRGEIRDDHQSAPVTPLPVTWRQLAVNSNQPIGHEYDLVSIEGRVVMQVREAAQDEYVLVADGHLFSAIFRHPQMVDAPPLLPLKEVPLGARIRVTGICMIEGSNSFNGDVPFSIILRTPADILIVAKPSWLNVRNLMLIVSMLVAAMIAIIARGWRLERKVRRQTTALASRIEAEAALERQRSRILEDINGSRSLAEILEQITTMVSTGLGGAPCWCHTSEGMQAGNSPSETEFRRIIHEEIPARCGSSLGALFVALDADSPSTTGKSDALTIGAQLASLAIETRRIYTDLLHRSEFDLLTDIHNRFSLEKHLEALIGQGQQTSGSFGLIYIDLDRFKQVNDVYGHGIGDAYLQSVALRMQRQLRGDDLLARLGGDEFAALIAGVRSRADVEEVAVRLERCFEDPYLVKGYFIQGAASIGLAVYPNDAVTRDGLLNAADAAMYVAKYGKRKTADASSELQTSTLVPENLV
jgi:diguanylate cyclase (GGDEF)-like protein